MWFTPDNLNLAPNKDDKHYCSPDITATNFTHLMKLVLLTQESPKAFEMLKQVLKTISTEDLNAQNSKGWTALMLAAGNSNIKSTIETIRVLINAGANLNLQNKDGWTALMLVAANSNSNIETVKLLINAGANLDIQNAYGWTALMIAFIYFRISSNAKTIKLLIDAGANLDIQNNDGWTALIIAFKFLDTHDIITSAQLLISADANPMLKTKNNETVCDIIANSKIKYLPVLKLLCDAELHYILTH